jgi:hypothetical protein
MMKFYSITGKGTHGMDKFGGVIDRSLEASFAAL